MNSEDSDAGPGKRKRKTAKLESSPSGTSTSSGSPVIGSSSRFRRRGSSKPSKVLYSSDESDSEDNSTHIRIKRKKALILSSGSDDSSSSGSDIVVKKRTGRIQSESENEFSSTSSDWESAVSDNENVKSGSSSKPSKIKSGSESDSSMDAEADKCPICLLRFKTQQIGTPEACDHMFCLECLQEWSKNMNTCPVDRQEYTQIIVRDNIDAKTTRTIVVEKPEPQNDAIIVEDPTYCEICGSPSNEDRLLLCDGCDLGFHLYCLTPPLNEVPAGSWYCNECAEDGGHVETEIELMELQILIDNANESLDSLENEIQQRGRRRRRSTRLIPRTQQTERVRRRIVNNRNQRIHEHDLERTSASSGFEDFQLTSSNIVSSTSVNVRKSKSKKRYTKSTTKRRRKRKSTRKSKSSGSFHIVYEIDEATGEAVPVKKRVKSSRRKRSKRKSRAQYVKVSAKTVKGRLASQLGICAPRNSVPQELPDVRVQSSNRGLHDLRHQAGIPTLRLFGQGNQLLDYLSASDDETYEYGNSTFLTRRAPNRSDVAILRRAARRKAAVVNIPDVSSSTDILGSILETQEILHSRKTQFSVDTSSGKIKVNNKDNEGIRKRPTSGDDPPPNSNNQQIGVDYTSDYPTQSNYFNFSSGYEETPAASSNNDLGNDQFDTPQDYTRQTLCEAELMQDLENKQDDRTNSTSPVSESDVDIYSDIEGEAVTTTRAYEPYEPTTENYLQDAKVPSPTQEVLHTTPLTDEDNDSESGMVIDTDKTVEEHKEDTAVTSTVALVSDITGNGPAEPIETSMELQSEAVQSSSMTEERQDEEETFEGDGCPNASIYTNQNKHDEKEIIENDYKKDESDPKNYENEPKHFEDEVSNDGCPNFSIYSKESKNVAMTTDIAYQVQEASQNLEREMWLTTEYANRPPPAQVENDISGPSLAQPFMTNKKNDSLGALGLYSDSEDESVVKKSAVEMNNQKAAKKPFKVSDIKDMTEDILSEEERSYTPCLDERMDKSREGLDGLDTEMISDEERNDFDESHELKTVSDGDALEINAKESELDFTRPEDYEEGEIVDKNKEKVDVPPKDVAPESDSEKKKKEKDDKDNKNRKKKEKTKEKSTSDLDKSGNKENENSSDMPFKKLSKNNRDRNYRGDRDRGNSRSPEKTSNKEKDKENKKKREKRRELERYNVRALIADKPRAPPKDKFGRDIRNTPTRSRSKSYTPPVVHRSTSRERKSPSKTRRSLSKSPVTTRRSASRPHRSLSRGHSKEREKKKRGSSRGRRRSASRSRSPLRKQSSRSTRKRKRSFDRSEKRKKYKDRTKSKKRESSRSRNRSRSGTPSRRRSRAMRDWSPSFSHSPTPEPTGMSPSWTPPRRPDMQAGLRNKNLTVILNNDSGKKRKERRRKPDKRKEGTQKKRRRERERTPPPSKEVFASGDNILVSVSFNNENETRDVTTRDRRKKDTEKEKKKEKKKTRQKKDLSGVKPVAIIDLERSPFQEIPPSPKEVIILSDSDNNDNENRNAQNNICDSSQQVASPERIPAYTTGPKTPPEPQVKFTLNAKQTQLRAISNPLHDAEEANDEEELMQEEEMDLGNNSIHKGPNTPPEPPNSPPSSPDAYDPFEPTKSRSVTPEPTLGVSQTSVVEDLLDDILENRSAIIDVEKAAQSPDVLKSLTPPVADIQPADSQSSIQATPDSNVGKSPEQRIGVIINQQVVQNALAANKPVAQTTPFSSVPTSMITSTPISTNLATSRINILSSTLITPSVIPQRIVLPNQVKSSPVKISPTKAIKPMQSKSINKSNNNSKKVPENLDLDSPYSPGSSDYEDLFEPPTDIVTKPMKTTPVKSTSKVAPQKSQSAFDTLFGSPVFNKKKSSKSAFGKKSLTPSKTKQVGVKVDEDSLKILDELPNSAVEMQVKDKFLKKLNRQERVVEEVKLVLKPYYNKKKINKEEYKDIMRRAVPKICHNKSGEINPSKIKHLVEAYVKKCKHSKKVTSSSSVPQKGMA